jgi:tetratricopeptide (TPR) repeat protein
LQKTGRLEEAEQLYRESLAQRTGFAEALLNLGHTLAALGRDAEARESWVEAIRMKPELATGYFLAE